MFGALNIITFYHLASCETAPCRLEQKQTSRDSSRNKIKNRNQEPFHPKRSPKDVPRMSTPSSLLTLSSSCSNDQSLCSISPTHPLLQTFQDYPASLRSLSLSSFTMSCSVFVCFLNFILPVIDWRKTGRVTLKSTHVSNNQPRKRSLQR